MSSSSLRTVKRDASTLAVGLPKKDILLIKTGGTIAQKADAEGVFRPSAANYLRKAPALSSYANIHVKSMGNIDSTDMETRNPILQLKDRASIAELIFENANRYDGFVVVHGTDTMAETAAALTYMLPGFRKPIVLTGSQRSAWVHRTDAPNNLYTAVQAATMDIGEVVIAFGNYVLRGSKARKVDEEGFDAFITPGVEPLGRVTSLSVGIRLFEHRIKRSKFTPKIFTDFETRIFNYYHVSGATIDKTLLSIAESDEVQGVLLSGFGAGNVPTRLLPFIVNAINNSKPVFVYTACDIGAADMGIYAVGAAPLEAGAKSAGDMTLEALGQKLMFALGKVNARNLVGKEKLLATEAIIRRQYNLDITVTEKRR